MHTPDSLTSAKNNSNSVPVHMFIMLSASCKDELICFFEGKDAPYYVERIKNICNIGYQPIKCGNKKKVIDTYNTIVSNSLYAKYKLGFFIDKDFDESFKPTHTKIYETFGYSIENFYNQPQVFEDIVKSEFGFSKADNEFNMLINLYKTRANEFNECVRLFNGWYHAVKKKSQELSLPLNVKLGENFPSDYLEFTLAPITQKYDLARLKADYSDAIDVTEDEVQESINYLNNYDPFYVFRGKYQVYFLHTFIAYLIEDSKPKGGQKVLSSPIKLHVSRSTLLSHFSHYAVTPDCLRTYLMQFN